MTDQHAPDDSRPEHEWPGRSAESRTDSAGAPGSPADDPWAGWQRPEHDDWQPVVDSGDLPTTAQPLPEGSGTEAGSGWGPVTEYQSGDLGDAAETRVVSAVPAPDDGTPPSEPAATGWPSEGSGWAEQRPAPGDQQPAQEWPAPEQPAQEWPAPEQPAQEWPAPERPTSETSAGQQYPGQQTAEPQWQQGWSAQQSGPGEQQWPGWQPGAPAAAPAKQWRNLDGLRLLAQIACPVLMVIGLSFKDHGVYGWHEYTAWAVFAAVGAVLQLAPVARSSLSLAEDQAWFLAVVGTAALVGYWVIIVLPFVELNTGFAQTLGVTAAVIGLWLSPRRPKIGER